MGDSLLAKRQLDETLDEYWRETLPKRPVVALASGFLVNGFRELSFEATRGQTQFAQGIVRALDRVNTDALTPSDYLTFLTLQWDAESRGEAALFFWTDFSELSPRESSISESFRLLAAHPLQTAKHVESYLYLVEAIAFQFGRVRAALEQRRGRGFVASRDEVQSYLGFLRTLHSLGSNAPWNVQADRLAALDSAGRLALNQELSSAVGSRVLPALDSLVSWIEKDYLPSAPDRLGLWQYPGGKEHYRYLLRRKSSLEVLPEEAHQVGLAELRRIDGQLEAVRQRMQWKGTVEALHDSLRRTAPALGDSAMVNAARDAERRIAPLLESKVLAHVVRTSNSDAGSDSLLAPSRLTLRLDSLTIRLATPLERLLNPAGGWVEEIHGSHFGVLAVTPSWQRSGGAMAVAARTYRDGAPGRALQRSVVLSDDSIPAVRRWTEVRGYVDGWSEYAASLAGELGMYSTPRAAYMRLLDEGFAAALLIVDTGLHYLGWTRAQALAVMRRYSLESPATLDSIFVERVVDDPGGAGVAALGAREFAAQRTWMQRELGGDFDLRDWHAAVLTAGAVPLPILASHLEQWLYETRRAKAAERLHAAKQKGKTVPAKKP